MSWRPLGLVSLKDINYLFGKKRCESEVERVDMGTTQRGNENVSKTTEVERSELWYLEMDLLSNAKGKRLSKEEGYKIEIGCCS